MQLYILFYIFFKFIFLPKGNDNLNKNEIHINDEILEFKLVTLHRNKIAIQNNNSPGANYVNWNHI